ncbi:Formate--tetrahydrofolate ligase [Trichinella spiralis]|uniref:Formate--tetrahydrofolate ligase n=1 Tax=Trichinella spiralis TaxID=6334 RepID=A0ABR3KU83_TRISP
MLCNVQFWLFFLCSVMLQISVRLLFSRLIELEKILAPRKSHFRLTMATWQISKWDLFTDLRLAVMIGSYTFDEQTTTADTHHCQATASSVDCGSIPCS